MGRYSSTLSTEEVGELEEKRISEILNTSNLSDEAKEEVLGSIREAYFQLTQCCASAKTEEEYILKTYGQDAFNTMIKQVACELVFRK